MRTICPKCKGNGYHKEPIRVIDILFAPLMFGVTLCKKDVECKVCDGEGYLEE